MTDPRRKDFWQLPTRPSDSLVTVEEACGGPRCYDGRTVMCVAGLTYDIPCPDCQKLARIKITNQETH